ncbi:MAG TPA: hypothetical protein VF498_05470 [Anaerolineales bacterium]
MTDAYIRRVQWQAQVQSIEIWKVVAPPAGESKRVGADEFLRKVGVKKP